MFLLASHSKKRMLKQLQNPNIQTFLGLKKYLKTDNTENGRDNTKEDDSDNPKKKLKDISNTDKETYE